MTAMPTSFSATRSGRSSARSDADAKIKHILTEFGETLSWTYLCYVRTHPVSWRVPTHILYGAQDDLTSLETILAFTGRIGAALTVMPDGEHWFHTDEQMRFLDKWITA